MWFSVRDFPKFVQETLHISNWHDSFRDTGFKTHQQRIDTGNYLEHWLDEHEFTWFVLRYS